MSERTIHSSYQGKTESYSQFRWGYAPEAIARLCEISGLRAGDCVADVGAGPGTLGRHFLALGMQVWAVEPDAEMRAIAETQLGETPHFHSIPATAEETGLADASIDLIAVGRALHWFSAPYASAEFRRILRPAGWMAVLQVVCTDSILLQAQRQLRVAAYGFDAQRSKASRPAVCIEDYLGHSNWIRITASSLVEENFEDFFGRQQTFSDSPKPDHPLFDEFRQATYETFTLYAKDGLLPIPICTEILAGQMIPADRKKY
jgi:SAM-dependent methyltransferase